MTTKKTTTKKAQKFTETLVIDRKRWLRGEREMGDSYLYRGSDKKMCCLGFYVRQHGCRVKDIKDIGLPGDLESKPMSKLPEWMVFDGLYGKENSQKTMRLADTNDSDKLSPKVRAQRITSQFAKVGVRVKFVN